MNVCPYCSYSSSAKICPRDGFSMVGERRTFVTPSGIALVGRVFEERYEVKALLGQSALGWVYRAGHPNVGQTVALRLFAPEYGKDLRVIKRFYKLGRAAERLRHPNTVRIHDFGASEDGFLYLVMDDIEGLPLSDVLPDGKRRTEPLDVGRALRIARQVCHSLVEAHELGIAHDDLRPCNVFLVRAFQQDDWVKVGDYGLGRLRRIVEAAADGDADLDFPDPDARAGGDASSEPAYGISRLRAAVRAGASGAGDHAGDSDVVGAPGTGLDLYGLGRLLFHMVVGAPASPLVDGRLPRRVPDEPPADVPERVGDTRLSDDLRALLRDLLGSDATRPAMQATDVERRLAALVKGEAAEAAASEAASGDDADLDETSQALDVYDGAYRSDEEDLLQSVRSLGEEPVIYDGPTETGIPAFRDEEDEFSEEALAAGPKSRRPVPARSSRDTRVDVDLAAAAAAVRAQIAEAAAERDSEALLDAATGAADGLDMGAIEALVSETSSDGEERADGETPQVDGETPQVDAEPEPDEGPDDDAQGAESAAAPAAAAATPAPAASAAASGQPGQRSAGYTKKKKKGKKGRSGEPAAAAPAAAAAPPPRSAEPAPGVSKPEAAAPADKPAAVAVAAPPAQSAPPAAAKASPTADRPKPPRPESTGAVPKAGPGDRRASVIPVPTPRRGRSPVRWVVLVAALAAAAVVAFLLLNRPPPPAAGPQGPVAGPTLTAAGDPARAGSPGTPPAPAPADLAPPPAAPDVVRAVAPPVDVVAPSPAAPDVRAAVDAAPASAAAPDAGKPPTAAPDAGPRAPAQPEVVPPPAAAAVRLVTDPPGAVVREGQAVLGTTPFTLDIGRGKPRTLAFALRGYRTVIQQVTAEAGPLLSLRLERKVRQGREPGASQPGGPSGPSPKPQYNVPLL